MFSVFVSGNYLLTFWFIFIYYLSFAKSEDGIDHLFPDGATMTRLMSLVESSGILSEGSSLAEIQKAAGNSSENENSKAHRYLVSILAEMITLDWNFMGSHKEPSVVAVFPHHGIGERSLEAQDHETLVFNLTQTISRGIDSVTATEIVLFRNPKLLEKLSQNLTFQLKLTLCDDSDTSCNIIHSREMINDDRKCEVFSVTEVFRDIVTDGRHLLKMVLSVTSTVNGKKHGGHSETETNTLVGNQVTQSAQNLRSSLTGGQADILMVNQTTTAVPQHTKIHVSTTSGNQEEADYSKQNPADLNDALILHDPEQGPVLIVYHNMQPLYLFEVNHTLGDPILPKAVGHNDENISGNEKTVGLPDGHIVSEMEEGRSNSSSARPRRFRRQRRRKGFRSVNIEPSYSLNCGLHTWTVDFHGDLRWTWIKYPSSVKLNFCSGVCPSPLEGDEINSTNNAFIRDQFHVASKWEHSEIPLTSCVPIKLAPVDVYYVTSTNDHVIKRLPDVIVMSCACL